MGRYVRIGNINRLPSLSLLHATPTLAYKMLNYNRNEIAYKIAHMRIRPLHESHNHPHIGCGRLLVRSRLSRQYCDRQKQMIDKRDWPHRFTGIVLLPSGHVQSCRGGGVGGRTTKCCSPFKFAVYSPILIVPFSLCQFIIIRAIECPRESSFHEIIIKSQWNKGATPADVE